MSGNDDWLPDPKAAPHSTSTDADEPKRYDEKAIAAAQKAWRAQDLETWGKTNPEKMAKRHNALLDLLCAHIPRAALKETTDGDS